MNLINLPKKIKSNEFATITAILAMLAQSKHTFQAFLFSENLNTPDEIDIAFSVLSAIVIDLAILFYTLRNRKDIAIGAMLVMIVINSYAYWIIHDGIMSIKLIGGLFFSSVIPVSVFFYSEEVKVLRPKKKGHTD